MRPRLRAFALATALAAGAVAPVAASAGPAAAVCSPASFYNTARFWTDSKCQGLNMLVLATPFGKNSTGSDDRSYVGNTFNDKISSVENGIGVSMSYMYQHANYQGCRKDLAGNTALTIIGYWSTCGGNANDQVSSIRVRHA